MIGNAAPRQGYNAPLVKILYDETVQLMTHGTFFYALEVVNKR